MASGLSQVRMLMWAINAAGVASVTLDVVTRPVRKPRLDASSSSVASDASVPGAVLMRPRLVTAPVAMDVALLAESAT